MAPVSDAGSSSDPEKTTRSQDKARGEFARNDEPAVSGKDGGEKGHDTAAETQGPPLSPIHETAFISVICMAQFLSLAGLAQTIAPMNIIGRSFNITDEATLSWYPAAFSLTVGTFILPAGRLGDMYGHKRLYMIGFGWYAVWSVIAGVAVYSGDILFSTARAFQGIGCALLVPNALALAGRTYGTSPKKNMIFALFGAAAPTGWVVGAVSSSILAQLAWWPWAFFALAVTCVVMMFAAAAIIPTDEVQAADVMDFDFLGRGTGVGGLVLFNFACRIRPCPIRPHHKAISVSVGPHAPANATLPAFILYVVSYPVDIC